MPGNSVPYNVHLEMSAGGDVGRTPRGLRAGLGWGNCDHKVTAVTREWLLKVPAPLLWC